ncbi:hypothetical protein [Nitrogeniibacter aestuarii]|uniref:hypothetical protein n=1 Tax=Nitrogeniibacter aestuarii TaxID=2815343 RepID=UPI001E48903F|nr:hypothetical protein [Nitrogeniibacter aestuarii]
MQRLPDSDTPQSTALRARLAQLGPAAIALYGIGMRARDLIDELSDYPIVGLLDKDADNIGKHFFGQPVLSPETAVARGARAVVIAATDVYWHTIARRIRPWCDAADVSIVFPDGTLALHDAPTGTTLPPCCDRAALEAAIAGHQVVSFDLFETLVTRQAWRPDDILELAAQRATNPDGPDAPTLLSARKAAEADCLRQHGHHTVALDVIYAQMRAASDLPANAIDRLHAAELATELALCLPRTAMIDALRRTRQAGKSVWITTDTMLPRETLNQILARCGLPEPPSLLVSSEAGLSKSQGGLFDLLRARHPHASIVHVGDSLHSDVTQARAHGLAALRLAAPAEQLAASPCAHWADAVRTAEDGQVIGLLAQRLFKTPFTPPATLHIESFEDFGYTFFGPLLLAYLGWLVRKLENKPVEQLLFFAREGHLLVHLYEKLCTHLGGTHLPAGTYFVTSRRMATVAALRTEDDVRALMNEAFTGTARQWLALRFGLDAPELDDEAALDNTDARARELVEQHMDAILAHAAQERAGYEAYLAAQGIDPSRPTAVCDLGLKGTIQHALEQVFQQPLDGYYITGHFGDDNPFGMCDRTDALFNQRSGQAPDAVYRYHILCESVLVAPVGMALYADAQGEPHFDAPRGNQQHFADKQAIHDGIEAFFDDWMASGSGAPRRLSRPLVDAIFGTSMQGGVRMAEPLKQSFFVDEAFRARTERRLWD